MDIEYKILNELKEEGKFQNLYLEGFPKVYYYDDRRSYKVLVMDFVGLNLENLVKRFNGRFKKDTSLLIAKQMVFLH